MMTNTTTTSFLPGSSLCRTDFAECISRRRRGLRRGIIPALLASLCLAASLSAAAGPGDTAALRVEGHVRHTLVLSPGMPGHFASHMITDIRITSFGGKLKKTLSARGVLLTDVLDSAGLEAASSKQRGRFRIILEARDGYRVVFSADELFNTAVGNRVYLLYYTTPADILQRDGPWISVSLADRITGPRYVKWLRRILVETD